MKSDRNVRIGVIGGSGLYQMPGIADLEEVPLETPFGPPSDVYMIGTLSGKRVAFLPRHGRGHRLLPSELNFRANIYGFKLLGVERIVSAGAVGSMRESIRPMDIVLPDQYIDRTRARASTFFGDGIVAHVGFADPICADVRSVLASAGRKIGARIHDGGTYVCMEGPAFSTRAESRLYRSWDVDVIGMTTLQEAKLSREAEICYATIALVTDYDCWHVTEQAVTVEQILGYLERNSVAAAALLREAVASLPSRRSCACAKALDSAIITDRKLVPRETRRKLAAILDRHLGGE